MKRAILAVVTSVVLIGCEEGASAPSVSEGSTARENGSRNSNKMAEIIARLETLEADHAEALNRIEALEGAALEAPEAPETEAPAGGVEMNYTSAVCTETETQTVIQVGTDPIGWHIQGSLDGHVWTDKFADAEYDAAAGTLTVNCGGFPSIPFQLAAGWRLSWWAAE